MSSLSASSWVGNLAAISLNAALVSWSFILISNLISVPLVLNVRLVAHSIYMFLSNRYIWR